MRHDEPEVRGYAVTHPVGEVRLPTQPGWDQVIYAKSGLFVARTDRENWTVPQHRALCVADGTRVRLETKRPAVIRCLYLRTNIGALTAPIRAIDLSSLTRELLLHAVDLCPLDLTTATESALVTLLIDRLASHQTAELQLPVPIDGRAERLAQVIVADPACTLTDAVDLVAGSKRTLERLFRSQTGMTLAGWQRRARVLASIEMMANDRPVTVVASEVGYATPSSFVAAFRSELGQSPRAFMNAKPSRPIERQLFSSSAR